MHPRDNSRFELMCNKLEAEHGVTLVPLWEGSTNRRGRRIGPQHLDIALFQIMGGKGGTMIVLDYGDNGYGTWFDESTNSTQALIERLTDQ